MGETPQWKTDLDNRINAKKDAVSEATKQWREALKQHKNDIMIERRDANYDFLKDKIPEMEMMLQNEKYNDGHAQLEKYRAVHGDAKWTESGRVVYSYPIALYQALLYSRADADTQKKLWTYWPCNCWIDGVFGIDTLFTSAQVMGNLWISGFHGVVDEVSFGKLLDTANIETAVITAPANTQTKVDGTAKTDAPTKIESSTKADASTKVDTPPKTDTSAKVDSSTKVDTPSTKVDTKPKGENTAPVDAPKKVVLDPAAKKDEFDDEFDTDDWTVDAPITLTNPEQITLPEAVAVADKKRIDYVKNNMIALIDQTMTQKIDKNFKKVLENVKQSLVDNKIDAKGIAAVAKQWIEWQLKNETKEKLQNKKNKPIFESFSVKMKQIANEWLNKPVYTFEMQEAERFTALDKKLEAHGKITESIEKNNAELMKKIEKEQQNYVTSVKNYNEQFAIKEKNVLLEKSLNKNDPAYTQKRQESYNAIFDAIAAMAVEAKKMQTSMINLALYEGTENWTDIEKNTDTIVQELTNTNTLLTTLKLGKTITPQINELNTLKTVWIPAAKTMSEQLKTWADAKKTDIMEEVTGTARTQTKTLNSLNKTLSSNQWSAEMKQWKDGYITPLTKTESIWKANFDEWTKTVEAKKQWQEKNNEQTDQENNALIEKKQWVLKQSTEQDTKLFAEADKKMSEAWGKVAEAIKKNPIDSATVTENMAIIKEQDVLRKQAKERISTHYYENQLLVQQTNHGEYLHMDDAVKATQALLDVKVKQHTSLVKKSDALKKQYTFLAEQSLVINDQDANSKATQESQKTVDAKMWTLEEEFGVLDAQIMELNKEINTLKTTVTELSLVRDTHQTDSEYLGYNAQHEITKERIATLNASENEFVASKGLLSEQSKVLVNDIATLQTQQNTLRTLPKDANDPKAKDDHYEFKQITGKYALSAKWISADRDLSTQLATKKTEDAAIQEQIQFIDEQIASIKQQRKPYEDRLEGDKNDMQTAKKKLEDQDAKAYKNVDNCYTPVYTPEQIAYPVEKTTLEEEKK